MLARRPVLLTNLTGLIAGFAMFGSFVLVPTFVQLPTGLPPVARAARRLRLRSLGDPGGALPAARLARRALRRPARRRARPRFGSKWPLSLGMALGVGRPRDARATGTPSRGRSSSGCSCSAAGVPFTFAAMAKLIIDSGPPDRDRRRHGMNTVMRTVGGVIGGQVGAAILTAHTIRATYVPAEGALSRRSG